MIVSIAISTTPKKSVATTYPSPQQIYTNTRACYIFVDAGLTANVSSSVPFVIEPLKVLPKNKLEILN